MKRIVCKVANVLIGGGNPVVIQTMCNTSTNDVEASVAQCRECIAAGAQMIRLTTQGLREVESLGRIKAILRSEGYDTPLIADIHFNAEVAVAAAAVAEKVRINPGNFARRHEDAVEAFGRFIKVCKLHGTAVRIGINHGSLGERITGLYGDTPRGMVRAAMEWLGLCISNDFYNVTVSLKSSNVRVMVDAYRLLQKEMEADGTVFPVHLGVTEAGNGDTARIKSAVGIGALLLEGIGDTIRVSLTENPAKEISAARSILKACEDIRAGALKEGLVEASNREEFIAAASILYGPSLLDRRTDDFELQATVAGKSLSEEDIVSFKDDLLQACRRRFTKPEYISCPGCGRTLYDLESTVARIKEATSSFGGITIAIMGCIVNGPGEMADADYGYVGEGGKKVALYRGRQLVERSIPQEQAITKLLALIESDRSERNQKD